MPHQTFHDKQKHEQKNEPKARRNSKLQTRAGHEEKKKNRYRTQKHFEAKREKKLKVNGNGKSLWADSFRAFMLQSARSMSIFVASILNFQILHDADELEWMVIPCPWAYSCR